VVDLFSDPGSIPGASTVKGSMNVQGHPEMDALGRFSLWQPVHRRLDEFVGIRVSLGALAG